MEKKTLKIVMLGSMGVGQTSLIARYVYNDFQYFWQKVTLIMDHHDKKIQVNGENIELQVWDIRYGERDMTYIRELYFKDVNAGILVFDITRNDYSVKKIHEFLLDFRQMINDEDEIVPVLLIGNKLDLNDKRKVKKEEALTIMKKYNIFDYIETSAKTGENVDKAFELLIKNIIKIDNK